MCVQITRPDPDPLLPGRERVPLIVEAHRHLSVPRRFFDLNRGELGFFGGENQFFFHHFPGERWPVGHGIVENVISLSEPGASLRLLSAIGRFLVFVSAWDKNVTESKFIDRYKTS